MSADVFAAFQRASERLSKGTALKSVSAKERKAELPPLVG